MTSQRTMLESALLALDCGLSVVPASEDGSKRPFGPWKTYTERLPTRAEVEQWFSVPRAGLGVICGKVSRNLESLDFDHGGIETWRAFSQRCEANPFVRPVFERVVLGYSERTPREFGAHVLWHGEVEIGGNQKLARRPATDQELAENPDDRSRVIFETRGEGGFVVTAPSGGRVHPTGRSWVMAHGGFDSIATISAAEREALLNIARSFDVPILTTGREVLAPARPNPVPPLSSPSASWVSETADDFARRTSWADVLEGRGWVEMHTTGGVTHWCRPGKHPRDGHSATTNANGTDRLIVWSTSVALPGIEIAGGEHSPSYDRLDVVAAYDFGGSRVEAAKSLRQSGFGPTWMDNPPSIDLEELYVHRDASSSPDSSGSPLPAPQLPSAVLPASIWTERPALAHVRTAALSMMLSPDAVLGALLVRVAALTGHSVDIPNTGVGKLGTGLTFFVGLVGPPETGKSTAASMAAALLPAPANVPDRLPIGSGEGMVDILYEDVPDPMAGPKSKATIKTQTKHAAIFHVDEGAVLAEVGKQRAGTTLLSTMRSAWSHEPLGSTNATKERRRNLPGELYVYGLTAAIQPASAGDLLADHPLGTPQRFLWVQAWHPDIGEDADYPGRLDWSPPDVRTLESITVESASGYRRHQLTIDPSIRAEVRAERRAIGSGQIVRRSEDAHSMLMRVKTATLLALLDRRVNVTTDDWRLAGLVVDNSRRVRESIEHDLGDIAKRDETKRHGRIARETIVVAETVEQHARLKMAKTIANRVRRDHEHGDHDGRGCTARCLSQATNPRDRKLASVESAVELAELKGWLQVADERYLPGESVPS